MLGLRLLANPVHLLMSHTKRKLERLDDLRRTAEWILLKSKVASKDCPHETIVVPDNDSESIRPAYALAVAMFRDKDPSVSEFSSQRELTDEIKAAITDLGDFCYSCSKWRDSDESNE